MPIKLNTNREASNEMTFAGTKTGQRVKLSLNDPVMAGICGASGTGKSVLLLNLMALLRRKMHERVQFVAFDPKLTSLLPVRSLLSREAITEPSDFLPELNTIIQIMEQRLVDMSSMHMTKISTQGNSDTYPMIVVIFEECLSLLHNPDNDKATQQALAEAMVSYCTRCRAANMGFIVCSHDFAEGVTGVPKQVRSSCRTRFLFRNGVNECGTFTEKMPDRAPAYNLTQTGLFYYSDNDLTRWTKCITEYKPDSFYENLADSYRIYNRDVDPRFAVTGLYD